ncbi:MAG TPA: MFS transporter [Deltaproteobacteria bacterium]|nr:MFS transporter [Deltaproteobacteria bacterium]
MLSMRDDIGYPSPLRSWLIWSSGSLFFLLGFFHRMAPAVLHRELTIDFSLSASSLGGLTSLYFYSYTAMQIPTGLLADRFGPRRLLTVGLASTALSSVFFALAQDLFWAGIARFLIGGSVAIAFVTTLKLSSHWLPQKRYAFAAGLLLVAGMTGAVFAGFPLHTASLIFGWRDVTMASALLAALMAGMVFWYVRDDPTEKGFKSYSLEDPGKPQSDKVLDSLRRVFTYRNTWYLFIAPGGVVGAVLTFSGLWGVPFLSDVYHLDNATAAFLCSVVMLALALSGPAFSLVSERILLRRMPYLIGSIISLISWTLIFWIPNWSIGALSTLLFLAGFFSGGMILGFAQGKETLPPSLSGTVTGVINMGVLTGPMLLQPLVGVMLDFTNKTESQTLEGVRVFTFEDYQIAFLPLLLWLMLSVFMLFLSRESFCRQQIYDKSTSPLSTQS